MTLRLRKIAYCVLASGSIATGALAVTGLLVAIGVAMLPSEGPDSHPSLAGLILGLPCAAGLVGIFTGFRKIFVLPAVMPRQRRRLTAGLVAGIVPAAALGRLDIDGTDVKVNIYLLWMPALTGLALLAELWWPLRSGRSTPTNSSPRDASIQ